jgi:hypothetical protein
VDEAAGKESKRDKTGKEAEDVDEAAGKKSERDKVGKEAEDVDEAAGKESKCNKTGKEAEDVDEAAGKESKRDKTGKEAEDVDEAAGKESKRDKTGKEGNVAVGEAEEEKEEEHGEDDDEEEVGGAADGEDEDEEEEELLSAAKRGNLAVVKECLADGTNADATDGVSSSTPPRGTQEVACERAWRLLSLQQKNTCYFKPGNGHLGNAPLSRTLFFLFEVAPAHALSLSRLLPVCPFFLQNGATALMWAARNGRADVAEVLVAAGADTNATDKVS